MLVLHPSVRPWLEHRVIHSTRDGIGRTRPGLICALLLLVPAAAGGEDLTVADAIRRAWSQNEGLAAASLEARSARERAGAASAARLPTLALSARGVATDEPMMAFGLKLDEARIGAADFDPARLNSPSLIGGVGLGATLTQPLYAGGRLSAGAAAARAQADAGASVLQRRRQEMALSVTEAYFGAEVAAQGLGFAADVLAHARETERFLRERSAQGLVLESEVARATAFRAQAEAQRVAAEQRLASARSALALFAGEEARGARLVTPLEPPPAPPGAGAAEGGGAAERPDVRALKAQAEAARSAVKVAKGTLLPELFAQVSAETMRSALDQGATWVTGVIGARWQLGLSDLRAARASESRADAADAAVRWQERQAAREVEESRRAIEAADARVRSAGEAVAASESARSLRLARHRQGLLPLTEVLDAEAGLAGARALLLQARLEARLARAQLSLALGEPVEGTEP
jgi:outer membrane protein TolC